MNFKKSYYIIFAFIYFFCTTLAAEKVSINGIVNDSNGKPVKKAEVELLTSKKKSITKIKTDKNGNFSFEDIDAQNYYIEFSKKKEFATVIIRSWSSQNKSIKNLKVKLTDEGNKIKTSFGPNPKTDIGGANMAYGKSPIEVINAPKMAQNTKKLSIAGIVNDAKGNPAKKAEIELLTSNKESITKLKTDKNGKFNLSDIDAKNYYLEIKKKKESATVIIRSWPSQNKSIKNLKVKLTEEGNKIKTSFGPNPKTENGGANIAYGKSPITPNSSQKSVKKIPKKVEKVFVSGKVINKKGKPVKKATIIVIDENYNSVAELETDKEGLFNIENLKPANYNLTVSKRKMLVKFKLKSWPKNNQNIKDIGVTLTKEKQEVMTLTFGPEPPQANAGKDQELAYEKDINIDGSQSYNPDNIIQSYKWRTLSNNYEIEDPTKPNFSFLAPKIDQSYHFELTVKGPGNIIDTDSVKVDVYNKNIFPIAIAGEDQIVDIGDPIILDGSKSNDPDGEIKSYLWRPLSGSKTTSKNWSQPVINVKTTSALVDTLTFELKVEDKYNFGLDTLTIFILDIPEPLVIITSSSSAIESTGAAKISLGVSSKSGKKASIYATSRDSTASGNGKDYTNVNKIISVPAGKSRINFPLNINNDNIDEYNETLIIDLIDTTVSNANTGAARKHILTIIDDDPPPSVEFLSSKTTVSESAGKHFLILALSNQSGKKIYVDYQIDSKSSAINGQDFNFNSGTAHFPIGSTRDTLDILLINDTIDEPSQNIIISLFNPVNSSIGSKNTHTVKINDDDIAPYIYVINERGSGLESDSSKAISYALSTHSEKEISVKYRVSSYGTTSRRNKDYILDDGVMVFPTGPGGYSSIKFKVIDDKIDEFDELLIINLFGEPENASLGTSTRYTYTIIDNDDRPTIEFSGDDHGNDFISATKIQIGSSSSGLIELGGDVDVFRFDLKYPITVLTKSSGKTDVYAEILDNAGQLLASDDNGKDSNNFMIKIPLLPGPHFLRIKHYSIDGTGDYVMTLESSELYDKRADNLILNKTMSYFHKGHVIYNANINNDGSYKLERIQINSKSFNLDSKRFIKITVNDSIEIDPSYCYVPSYGRYENLGIIQKNYISNPLKVDNLPRYLPTEDLDNSLVFGTVLDYVTRKPIFGAEVRIYGSPNPATESSQTSLINLADGETWNGGNKLPSKKPLYKSPSINKYPEEKGRRITGLNGKFAIAVRDTGFLMIRANAPTNNYRFQEKKIKIRYEKGDFYGTNIWLVPK